MLILLTLLTSLATADDAAYATCCAEAGAFDCPAALTVVGPGTDVSGSHAEGLWKVTCEDGASFYPHAERDGVDTRPGAVTDRLDPAGLACFQAACPLPEDLCLVPDAMGVARARTCGTAQLATREDFASPPRRRTAVVASAGRVVRAERLSYESAVSRASSNIPARTDAVVSIRRTEPTTTSEWAPKPAAPTAVAQPVPAPQPSPWNRPTVVEPSKPAPEPSRVVIEPLTPGLTQIPTRTAQLLRAEPSERAPGVSIDWTMPSAPPEPCVPNPALRAPSTAQVDLGDEAVVAGDVARGVGHYRAALGVDQCNGYGWAALGALLVDAGYASRAKDALSYATRLTPNNVLAWVRLGGAYELLHDTSGAITAYHRAIELRPGYLPAEEGLRRVVRGH